MVGWPGFEPGTNALKGRCSTAELPAQIFIKQSANYMSQNGFIKHSHKYFTKKCNVSVIVGTLTPRPPALRSYATVRTKKGVGRVRPQHPLRNAIQRISEEPRIS